MGENWPVKLSLCVIGCLLFIGCAPVSPNLHIGESINGQVPKPEEGNALMVFIRPEGFIKIPYEIYDGERLIGGGRDAENCNFYQASPGTHLFNAAVFSGHGYEGDIADMRFTFLDSELVAGKTYYVHVKQWNIPFFGWGIGLDPISPRFEEDWANLPNWLASCKRVDLTPESHAWAKKYAPSLNRMRNQYHEKWENKEIKHTIKPEDGS